MNRFAVLLSLCMIVFVLLFSGCGQDGETGDAYIAYSWSTTETIQFISFADYRDTQPEAFNEEHAHVRPDPAFPEIDSIENGVYRSANPGHWGIAYLLSDGEGYWAVYEIFVEKGGAAQLFFDATDGRDLYFELVCTDQAQFHVWYEPVRSDSASPTVTSGVTPLVSLGYSGVGVGTGADVGDRSSADVGDAPETHSFQNKHFRVVFHFGRIVAPLP